MLRFITTPMFPLMALTALSLSPDLIAAYESKKTRKQSKKTVKFRVKSPGAQKSRSKNKSKRLPATHRTVTEVVSAEPRLATFNTALQKSGLAETLAQKGHYTVFAPINEALTTLEFENLLQPEHKNGLTGFLKEHITNKRYTVGQLKKGKAAQDGIVTQAGNTLKFSTQQQDLLVNNARVIATLKAKNGIIHLIDKAV